MPEEVASGGPGPKQPKAPAVDLAPDTAAWDAFVSRSTPGSYLQTSAWAEVKAPNGWAPLRFMGRCQVPPLEMEPDEEAAQGPAREVGFGAQLLLRRPRVLPWAFAYSPRGPVLEAWNEATVARPSPPACVGPWRRGRARSRTCASSRRSS